MSSNNYTDMDEDLAKGLQISVEWQEREVRAANALAQIEEQNVQTAIAKSLETSRRNDPRLKELQTGVDNLNTAILELSTKYKAAETEKAKQEARDTLEVARDELRGLIVLRDQRLVYLALWN